MDYYSARYDNRRRPSNNTVPSSSSEEDSFRHRRRGGECLSSLRSRKRRKGSFTEEEKIGGRGLLPVFSEAPYLPLPEEELFSAAKGRIVNTSECSPLSMDSGYNSLPPGRKEEDVFFLCPNCGLFKRNDHCQCEGGEDGQGGGRDRGRIEPFGGSSKTRTIGVVEPIVVQKSSTKPFSGERKGPFRRMKRRKRHRKKSYGRRSGETSSDVDGDLDSNSSSEESKSKYTPPSRQVFASSPPLYLNSSSSSVVLSSHISTSSSILPEEVDIDKKTLLHGGNMEDSFKNALHPSSSNDILQASISSLFDEPIPHVDDLLTNIDLQPMGIVPETPSPEETTLFRAEPREQDWLYCQEKGCGFWTRKSSRMERHIATHQPDAKYYKCPDCPLRFYSLAKMLRHDRRIHTGVKEYECRVCDAEVTDIQIHMRVHKEEKQFECTMCSMRFRHKNSLVRHLCQHTGERPYPCSLCDSAFVSLHRLKEHVKRHHEKPATSKPAAQRPKTTTSASLISSQTLIYNQTESISTPTTFPTLFSISNSSSSSSSSSSGSNSLLLLAAAEPSKSNGLLTGGNLYIASPLLNSQTALLLQSATPSSPFIIHTAPPPSLEPVKALPPFSCKDCGRTYKLDTFLNAHRRNCSRRQKN